MLTVRFGKQGDMRVRWSRKIADILALGRAYVNHEITLLPDEQLTVPLLSIVQATLDEALAADAEAKNAEAERSSASESFKQQLELAKALIRQARYGLMSTHAANLADLERWGFNTVLKQNGEISLRLPGSQQQWMELFGRYIGYEGSLPLEQQVQVPPFAEVLAQVDQVNAAYQARQDWLNQREAAHGRFNQAAERLLTLLQLAACNLVVTRFEDRVTADLQAWGFDVVASSSSPPPPEEEPPPAP